MTYGEGEVRAALRRVWPDAATVETAEIRALGGGLNARTFLAVAGSRRHVLRMPTAGSVALLDLATEARAMRAAAAAGLAPAVVAVDLEEGLLLTEHGVAPCTPEVVRQPAVLTLVVRLLRALHRLELDLPVYAVERIGSRYLRELEGKGVLTTAESAWAAELVRLGRHFDAAYPPTAFCHTDLVAANILNDGATARLIDFEYAGRGTPLLDLASFAGSNDLADSEQRQLLDEYFGTQVAAPTLCDLGNAIRMLRLLAYFWARVAEERIADTQSYSEVIESLGATLRRD